MIIIPTFLSLLRILLTPIFVLLFWQGGNKLLLSIGVFTLAALTDAFDGYFARRYRVTSSLGAFLDPLADKILIGSTFICLAIKGLAPWWLVVLIMMRDALVTLLRMSAVERGLFLATTKLAKYKTVVQFVALYMAFVWLVVHEVLQWAGGDRTAGVVMASMYVMVFLTAYTGIDYVIKYVRLVVKNDR